MTPLLDTPGAATFDTTSARQFVGCRVCGRTLLLGERSVGFFTQSGEGPYDVCELCVPRAYRFGLQPHPSSPDEVARSHKRGFLRSAIAALRTRRRRDEPVVEGSAAVAMAAAAGAGRGRRSRRRTGAKLADPMALGAVPVGTAAIPMALAAFNRSTYARTLAGLQRTLGEPRSSVTPRSATDREVILTVAWEIVWYQFRIMPDGIEQQRGQYLSELQPRWQQWNCRVLPDGTVGELPTMVTDSVPDDAAASRVEGPSR